mmetsp:Transcript_4145/g.17011  ORF Transcript_4145/g.17011 Transcript_4145/m.17011 type:complete len:239 (-) Transcript_4145:1509-2225(-)
MDDSYPVPSSEDEPSPLGVTPFSLTVFFPPRCAPPRGAPRGVPFVACEMTGALASEDEPSPAAAAAARSSSAASAMDSRCCGRDSRYSPAVVTYPWGYALNVGRSKSEDSALVDHSARRDNPRNSALTLDSSTSSTKSRAQSSKSAHRGTPRARGPNRTSWCTRSKSARSRRAPSGFACTAARAGVRASAAAGWGISEAGPGSGSAGRSAPLSSLSDAMSDCSRSLTRAVSAWATAVS